MWDWHDSTAMWITMVIFWTVIAFLIFYAIRTFSERGNSRRSGDSDSRALEILDERYARGEISAEEYEERRRTLTRPNP